MTQGLFSQRTEPKIVLSHKLSPRSPNMAFSSVGKMLPQHSVGIALENVNAHYILIFNFIFYFIVTTDVIVVYCIGSLME